MSAAARTTGVEPTRDQISFCRQLYAGMSGANVELSTIDGDPDDREHHTWKYGKRRYTNAADLARAIAERAAAGLNVYLSVSAYEGRPRYSSTVDSPVIFVDDAPEHGPLAWSMYVPTSPDSGHGYIILDRPMPADERVRLARRLAAACGGDPSGVDVQQLGRPPGSVNGKKKCKDYRAWLKIDSGKRYSVADVEAATPDVAARTRGSARTTQDEIDKYIATVDFHDVETRRANIEQLICPDGYPWRFTNPHGQSRLVLTGELDPENFRGLRKHDSGAFDPSMARAMTIKGQIFHAYADPDIWAMQLHWGNFEHLGGRSTKGTADLKRDIARLILKYRAELAHITPIPIEIAAHKPAQPLPEASRRRKGRPRRGSADEYLDWLTENVDGDGQVMRTRRECAEHWNVSIPTVDRWEADLRARGNIQRHTSKNRQHSWIVLLGTIKNAPEPVLSAPETAPEVLSEPPRIMDARTREREHTAAAVPDPVPPVPPTWFDGDGVTARDTDAGDYSQRQLCRRPRARPVAERSLEERRAKVQRDLAALQNGIAKRLKLGVDPASVSGARRKAAEKRRELAELDRQIAAQPTEQIPSPAEAIPPGEQLTLAPDPMAPPEAAPIPPAACVSPLPVAGEAMQVLRRPDGGFLYAFDYWIKRGEPEKARSLIDANLAAHPGRYDFGPELVRLAGSGGATP